MCLGLLGLFVDKVVGSSEKGACLVVLVSSQQRREVKVAILLDSNATQHLSEHLTVVVSLGSATFSSVGRPVRDQSFTPKGPILRVQYLLPCKYLAWFMIQDLDA